MRAFIAALAFSGLCSLPALAEPVVSPLGDGGGIYSFHRLEKYQLYNAPTGVTHAGGTMRWHYNDANRPSGISKANAIARIQSAMAQWSAVCRISFAYQGETTTGFSLTSSNYDGVNVVGWDATTLSAPTTGITSVAWNGSNTFIDAEIRFNAAYGVTVSAFDSTAVHEVGHALGLDHSDVSGQVMSGPPLTSYNGRSALNADDIAGCVRLYGASGGSTADTQTPSIPAGLSAAAVSSTGINLTWSASSDNVGVTQYVVYRSGTSLGSVSGAGASVTNLSPSTTYSFTVAACDEAGNCSSQSAPASATTQAAPATCTGSQPSNQQQTLSCPAGQVGSIVQSRGYSCVGTTWTPGAWQTVSNTCTSAPASSGSYQDMWWSPGENGWGVTITQHGDRLFLAWYVYDTSGRPTWVVMSSGQWDGSRRTYSGDVHIPSGAWFGNYDGSRFSTGTAAGSASVIFNSDSTGVLTYNVRGVAGSKSIARLLFGPVATPTAASYGDMWWAGAAENGWGLVLSQQYQTIFATWFTYDNAGQTTWFVMSNGTWTSSNTYTGALYRARGAPVIGTAYNPTAFTLTQVGTLTLTFTDASHATMTYTIDGLAQTKAITRFNF